MSQILSLLLKIILLPFQIIFFLGLKIVNIFYLTKILPSVSFDLPVIGVGNLTFGGAGKTPMTIYIASLLSNNNIQNAIISRGYKRKTKGFIYANLTHNADDLGDETKMLQLLLPDSHIAVAENRALGIPLLLTYAPSTQCVIMDDSFQHRGVTPGLNILLTPYDDLYMQDNLAPIGKLRDLKSAALRADIIVVTKCPHQIEKQKILQSLQPALHQRVYFSAIHYHIPYSLHNIDNTLPNLNGYAVVLFCGIAYPNYLSDYIQTQAQELVLITYRDHHDYHSTDLINIIAQYDAIQNPNKIILMTEKDAVKMLQYKDWWLERNISPYVIGITNKMIDHGEFDKEILDFVINFNTKNE